MTLPWPLEELLPHSGQMILIDDAIDTGDGWVEAGVRIAEDCLFYEPGAGIPSWIGIEYMAQTVALFSGIQAKRANQKVRVGFLLGTRRYEAATGYFELGSYLRIFVQEQWNDGKMAIFDCHIEEECRVASARLSVFQPPDLAEFLNGAST
jgi:predicted hotdog family 3-hydroxylacyl-ACP dehydratase